MIRTREWPRLLAAFLVAVVVSGPAIAQTATTGTIEGSVKDVNGQPIKGAKVAALCGRAPITAETGTDGRYTLSLLPPGACDVRVEKEGYTTVVQKNIAVAATGRVVLPFVLNVGKVEEVTVSAEAPLIDPKSTTTGAVFRPGDFQEYLPVQHNFTQSFALAPGVVSGLGTGAGNYSISGSSGLENSYIVDGVNITNTGYGGVGSYNIVYGSLGSGVTYDFLEEIQVKTGGIDVEYGQATGGVVNTVVKSGTNDLSGSVAVFFTPADGRGEFRDIHRSTGAVNLFEEEEKDFSASIGGPILKDRVFYFVAYNPVVVEASADIESAPIESDAPFSFDTFPANQTTYTSAGAARERKRTNDNWAAKFTWYANPNHRIELTGFGDPSDGDSGPQRFGSLRNLEFLSGGGQSRIEYGANNYSLKYDAVFTPNFFMQFQAARHDGEFREVSTLDKPIVTDRRQELAFLFPQLFSPTGERPAAPTLWTNGGAGFLSNADDVNTQYKAQATWLVGNHEVVAGAQYDDIEYTDDQAYSGQPIDFLIPLDGDGDGFFTAVNSSPECVGGDTVDCWVRLTSTSGTVLHRRGATHWRSVRARFFPTPPPTKTKDTGLFIKDTWSITPRVSFKFGLRATRQKIEGSGGFSLPLNAARQPITTTYSPGSYTFDWGYSPMLGVTFDVFGNGKSKFYANARRMYERIPNDLAVRSLSNEVGLSRYRWNAYDYASGTPSSPRVLTIGDDPIFFQGLSTTEIEPGTKLPYVDEVLLGWQQEVGKDLSIEVRAIYREQGRVLEDVQYNSIESIQNYYYGINSGYPEDPFPAFPVASPFGAYFLANPGDNTRTGANGETIPSAIRKYKAAEFIVNKRFSDHWLLYGNFRIARLRGNYEGLFRNDNGQSDPNITSLFDFPLSPLTEGQFIEGPLNTDRPYVAKIFGAYTWDNGITAGGAVNWESGVPRTPLLAHPIYINSGELPGANPTYGWWSVADDPDFPDPCDGALFFNRGSASDFGNDVCFAQALPMLVDYDLVGRGALGRTPDIASFDLHIGWRKSLGKRGVFQLSGSVFNLFGTREVAILDDAVELTAGTPNADFNTVIDYQDPRSVRVVARWSF